MTAGLRGIQLRRAVTGLLSFAAAEEQALLAADAFGPGSGGGSPDRWAAVPLVAHNNQFKSQQAERIGCLLDRRVPPAYGEIDHTSRGGVPELPGPAAGGRAGRLPPGQRGTGRRHLGAQRR